MNEHLNLWKNFVDSFANLHDGLYKSSILEKGSYAQVLENQKINEFISQLTMSQREILVGMLENARIGGVHDALVVLNDRMAINDGEYKEGGCVMEFQPFATELYYDYMGRKLGYSWPDEEGTESNCPPLPQNANNT